MALKDTLLSLTDTSKNSSFCKFGKIYFDVDEETRDALSSALKSGASTMDICRALNEDGLHIRREFLGEKRRCFTDSSVQCCLGPNRDGESK
jgi:hypothetical protein